MIIVVMQADEHIDEGTRPLEQVQRPDLIEPQIALRGVEAQRGAEEDEGDKGGEIAGRVARSEDREAPSLTLPRSAGEGGGDVSRNVR